MILVLQIVIGVVLGIFLAKWLAAVPHKLRVKRYRKSLLHLSDMNLMQLAMEGYEQIFSMANRDWLIEMSFSKDQAKRHELAARIAEDTADRWHRFGSGKGEGMPPLITSEDRKQLKRLEDEINALAETVKLAEKLKKQEKT